ncbi:ROK family protein [Streptomyces sp. SJL17-1]|uniref:ROK family protein n=1 Tax=Streptomyces sp. SJL17-1 TaxID=2967223 RepID=UPI0029675514|nr:ROK family protein [Streptomyces sp. SJL17-1]
MERAVGTGRHLGIDVGGTKVAFRVESEGEDPYEVSFPWNARHSAAADLAQLADAVGELRARMRGCTGAGAAAGAGAGAAASADSDAGADVRSGFRAVGVAMPATVAPSGRVLAWPSRPEWTGVELEAALRGLFPEAAVGWADDGDLGALAEAEEAGCDRLLYLGVGTGVGGGFVDEGAVHPGAGRGSFEIGHVIVERDGALCVCGRRGCVQAVASGPATLGRAARLRGAEVSFEALRAGVAEGAPWALAAVDEACAALAAAVVGVHELLHPRLTLIGGGFAEGMPGFVDGVARHVSRLARPCGPSSPVRPAVLGGLSSLRGACALARSL